MHTVASQGYAAPYFSAPYDLPPAASSSAAPAAGTVAPSQPSAPAPTPADRLLSPDDVRACIRASQAEHAAPSATQIVLAIGVLAGLVGAAAVFADAWRRSRKAKQQAAKEPPHDHDHASRMEAAHV